MSKKDKENIKLKKKEKSIPAAGMKNDKTVVESKAKIGKC